MKEYRDYKYFLDKDKLWKIVLDDNQIFIVALDDSKTYGNRKIVWENNNERTCKKYIDLIKN